jgi:16S rRNA processing protein RimM
MQQYFKIGKLAAAFGVQGELVLEHSLGKKTQLDGLEAIFLEEKKGAFLPYFIASTKVKSKNEIYILLDGIRTREQARLLIKREVWLSESDFKKFAAGASPISLLGFMVINNESELGDVIEVIEQPHQLLCVVIIDDKEVLIPVHEEFLKKLDKKNKKIYVSLPDGLLDIYKDGHE